VFLKQYPILWCLLIAFLWIGRPGPGAGREGKGKEGSDATLLGANSRDGGDASVKRRFQLANEAVMGFFRDLGLVGSGHGKVE
jgi:hypothetical protein